jgi:hypothetical protein
LSKVTICHSTETGAYVQLTVAAPSLPAHQAHGDGLPGDALPGHVARFGADCSVIVIVVDPATTFNTPIHGGNGGATFGDNCPAGYVGVGLGGTRSEWFGWATMWNFRMHCRELRGDGTLGASASTPPRANGDFAIFNIPFSGTCTSDQILVSGNGRHSNLISRIAGGCASISRLIAAPGGEDSAIGPFAGFGVLGANTAFNEACNPGYAVTGVIGRRGNVLDAVGFRCTQVIEQVVQAPLGAN